MKKPKIGDKCKAYDCESAICTITARRWDLTGEAQFFLNSGCKGRWLTVEQFTFCQKLTKKK